MISWLISGFDRQKAGLQVLLTVSDLLFIVSKAFSTIACNFIKASNCCTSISSTTTRSTHDCLCSSNFWKPLYIIRPSKTARKRLRRMIKESQKKKFERITYPRRSLQKLNCGCCCPRWWSRSRYKWHRRRGAYAPASSEKVSISSAARRGLKGVGIGYIYFGTTTRRIIFFFRLFFFGVTTTTSDLIIDNVT